MLDAKYHYSLIRPRNPSINLYIDNNWKPRFTSTYSWVHKGYLQFQQFPLYLRGRYDNQGLYRYNWSWAWGWPWPQNLPVVGSVQKRIFEPSIRWNLILEFGSWWRYRK
jgi:hypothetical protein